VDDRDHRVQELEDPLELGERDRRAAFVYLMGSLDAAAWQSKLARGEGPGRIYTVEPTR
jgi:hypothetical protein